VGEIFLPAETRKEGRDAPLPEERRFAAAVLAGHADGWLKPGAKLDFFDVKGVVEELLAALGQVCTFAPSREPWLHPGAQAEVLVDGKRVGVLGEAHPDVAAKLAIDARPLAFEIDLDALPEPPPPRMSELPRFPQVVRDLSFFVPASLPASAIRDAIEKARDPLCVEVRVLEDYREPGKVPDGQKGMLWTLTYRAPDRTLTDADVQTAHEGFISRLKSRLELSLR
jgi:phenylalanyl-tRNA synthetase beta chain